MSRFRDFHKDAVLFIGFLFRMSVVIFAIIVMFHGCKSNSLDGQHQSMPNDPIMQRGNTKPFQEIRIAQEMNKSLPSVTNLSSCSSNDSARPPPRCVWYFSTDAIVWGIIEQVRAVESPSLLTTSPSEFELLENCDGVVNPALEIVVAIEKTIRGDIHDRVTAHIGARQLYTFDPRPRIERNGETTWVSRGRLSGKALSVGQPIGLALHYVREYNIWSVMGESLFTTVYSNGTNAIAFQEIHGECGILPPYELEGLTIDEFVGTLTKCTESECAEVSEERRKMVIRSWGSRPEQYMTAVCMPGHWFGEREDGTCAVDSDCNVNEQCNNERCTRL